MYKQTYVCRHTKAGMPPKGQPDIYTVMTYTNNLVQWNMDYEEFIIFPNINNNG